MTLCELGGELMDDHTFGLGLGPRVLVFKWKQGILLCTSEGLLPSFPDKEQYEQGNEKEA